MSQPHVSSTSPSFFGHPNTLLKFQSLGHDTDDGDADWARPARENVEKTGGLFWGQKALAVPKRQRKQRPADKIREHDTLALHY